MTIADQFHALRLPAAVAVLATLILGQAAPPLFPLFAREAHARRDRLVHSARAVAGLWRSHRLHYSARQIDALTATRLHIGQVVVSSIARVPGLLHVDHTVKPLSDLLALSSATVGDSLPPQWQRRAVRGSRSPMSKVREDHSDRFFSISGQRQAAWFVLDLRRQPLARDGTATLEYRLPVLPAGADLAIAARSDAALRLYFVFESARRLLPGRRMLFYSLGPVNDGPRVKREGSLCDIRMVGTSSTVWKRMVVSPASDAARDCGWEDSRIVAVGLMQDTDQTGARAEADVRALTWRD